MTLRGNVKCVVAFFVRWRGTLWRYVTADVCAHAYANVSVHAGVCVYAWPCVSCLHVDGLSQQGFRWVKVGVYMKIQLPI